MSANAFHIVTTWHVTGSLDEVAAILTDATSLPRWWPEVYISTRIIAPGDVRSIGRQVSCLSKGRLPYRMNWVATLVDSHLPHSWTIAASGDLDGTGIWTLQQNGTTIEAVYDWQVKAEKPVLRLLSPLLAPLFAWNHRWAMAKGEAGLKREILKRRGQ
jgi:hypothetical protein